MTVAIAHKEGETEILDLVRERKPPFSPEAVVEEFASTILRYRCSRVYGDRYGGNWPSEQFMKAGVHLERAEKPKSEIYLDLLPLINSKAVRLLDSDRLMLQLVGLERTTKAGGRDKSTTRAARMMTLPTRPRVRWCSPIRMLAIAQASSLEII